MRIGSAFAQAAAFDALQRRRGEMDELQRQMSSGRRVDRPGADPSAAADAERQRARIARGETEQRTLRFATGQLGAIENALGNAGDTLASMREQLVAGRNATMSAPDRATLATALRQQRAQLVAIANREDGSGGRLFGGLGGTSAPLDTVAGATYTAQGGEQRVGSRLPLPTSIDGRALFTAVSDGAGGIENPFDRIDAAIAALEDPSTGAAAETARSDATGRALDAIGRMDDRVLQARTRAGEWLRAADAHGAALADEELQARERLSDLVDLDYARAITEFTSQKTALDAAMKTYSEVARLSLFDRI